MEQTTQLEIVNPKEFGLDETSAAKIAESFTPKVIELEGLMNVYSQLINGELSAELSKQAGELRRKLVKVRTGIAEIHKVEKAFYLAGGRYVDALKNKQTVTLEQMEEKLSEIEKYFERIEAEKLEKLKSERIELLRPHVDNPDMFMVGSMTEEAFNSLLEGQKLAKQAKVEAENKAEEARIEAARKEAEEKEAQRLENERLKAEAEAREKEITAERERREFEKRVEESERKAAEEKSREEREAIELKAKNEREAAEAEQKRIQAEADAKLKAEREAREKLEAENKAREYAERKQKEADEKYAKKLAAAPDREKIKRWVTEVGLSDIQITDPELKEKAGEIQAKFNGFKKWALELISEKS